MTQRGKPLKKISLWETSARVFEREEGKGRVFERDEGFVMDWDFKNIR